MANKKISLSLNVIAIAFSLGIISVAYAVNPFDITYPIQELGNCASQEECKMFCDNTDNQVVCMDWAAGKGFVDKKEAEKVREINELGQMPDSYGPGGCKTPGECDNYCQALEHLDECMNYSVEKGFISAEEAEKIKEKANRKGPGSCSSQGECENYCRNPGHIEECMNFAVEDGKISKEEADFIITQTKEFGAGSSRRGKGSGKQGGQRGPAEPKIDEQKALKVLEDKGGGPGGCKSMEECGNYCSAPEHGEECMNFAIKNGFMPPEEVEKAKKMMSMTGPGGCKGPRECDDYCSQEGHGEECMNFSIQNGLMAPEEAEKMKKEVEIVKKLQRGGMSGPGGCKGPQECQIYCSDQSHIEECMSFATQNGMMNKNDAVTRMRQVQDAQSIIQKGEQDRQRFMMPPSPNETGSPPQRFQGFMPRPPQKEGQFMPPEGFIPPEGWEGPDGFGPPPGIQKPPEGFEPSEGYEGEIPPQGMMPFPPQREGGFIPPQGFQGAPEGFPISPGMIPSSENMMPSAGFSVPEGMTPPTNMAPPQGMIPQGDFSVPPPADNQNAPPPPIISPENLPGLILKPFLDIFRAL